MLKVEYLPLTSGTLIRGLTTLCLVGGSALVMAADTGDAPLSYGLASHEIVSTGPFLGDIVADNNAAINGASALGDDEDGLDDEGGVFDFPVLVQNGKSYDTNVFASNPLNIPATLAGWVDFDGSGSFDPDEFVTAVVPAGSQNTKFKLAWTNLRGVTSQYFGTTYARFRITSSTLTASDATGGAPDGEVEDYSLQIQLDSDGDEIPDAVDPDNDNDGIVDTLDGTDVDADNDGTPNYLDADSDADSIPDYIEAGENPLEPVDTDNDGTPDFLDIDSDNDGVLDINEHTEDSDRDGLSDALEGSVDQDADGIGNHQDMDSDNDTIPDAIERGGDSQPVDSDGDGVNDYLDLDSDNDGIADIREANLGVLNVNLVDLDNDGRVDNTQLIGVNGYLDSAETAPDSGVPIFSIADTDADGTRDFRDLDSDNDGVSDLLEALGLDADGNGVLDSSRDDNEDGFVDGGNSLLNTGVLADTDADGVPDFQDSDADGRDVPQAGSGSNSEQAGTAGTTPDESTSGNAGSQGGTVAQGSENSQVIETGLSGGAGCSVSGRGWSAGQGSIDVGFSMMLLIGLVAFSSRRNRGC